MELVKMELGTAPIYPRLYPRLFGLPLARGTSFLPRTVSILATKDSSPQGLPVMTMIMRFIGTHRKRRDKPA